MRPDRVAPTEQLHEGADSSSLHLLARLQAAHQQVLTCMRLMEEVASACSPDVERLTAARLKISQASLARRALWHTIREHLQPKVSPTDFEALRNLAELDRRLFSQSSAHVSTWTVDAMITDWRGYQAASKAIRASMVECIKTEQSVLYPMLHAYR